MLISYRSYELWSVDLMFYGNVFGHKLVVNKRIERTLVISADITDITLVHADHTVMRHFERAGVTGKKS